MKQRKQENGYRFHHQSPRKLCGWAGIRTCEWDAQPTAPWSLAHFLTCCKYSRPLSLVYNPYIFPHNTAHIYEPAHDKAYNKTCVTSKDSDQPAHPHSLIRVFADCMCLLQPPGYLKRDKGEPLSYWVDVQADLSHCWLHRSNCRFCCALADILFTKQYLSKYSIYLKYYGITYLVLPYVLTILVLNFDNVYFTISWCV